MCCLKTCQSVGALSNSHVVTIVKSRLGVKVQGRNIALRWFSMMVVSFPLHTILCSVVVLIDWTREIDLSYSFSVS